MNILLVKQTSLGDVLHITPVIRAIKKCYPNANIDVVTDKRALPILENNPYIRKLYILDIYHYEKNIFKNPKMFLSIIREFINHIKEVRKIEYNFAIDLQGLERSVLFVYFAKAKRKIAKGKWLFIESNYYKDINAVTGLLSFLDYIDCKNDGNKLDFFLPADIKEKFDNKIKNNLINIKENYIVISPFSRWVTKDLNIEKTKEIIFSIKKHQNKQIIISATPDYKEQCSKISEGIENVISIAGILNIAELGYLMKNAYACVSVDSFPMHLASSFNTPLVALFGPTSEIRVGPLSEKSAVIRVENLECKMCYKRKNCPNYHKCMNNIESESIAKKIDELPHSFL